MQMKKLYLAVGFITMILLISCHLDEKIAFNLEFDNEANIPSIVGINLPIEIPVPDITTNISKELSANNSKKEYLNTAFLKELTITSKDPKDQDLDFIKKIELYIKADGLEEIKIAEKLNISDDIDKELTLDVFDDKDLSAYIKKDKFELKIKSTSRKILLHSTKVNIYTKFKVTADVF